MVDHALILAASMDMVKPLSILEHVVREAHLNAMVRQFLKLHLCLYPSFSAPPALSERTRDLRQELETGIVKVL